MAKLFRDFVNERLAAAALDIFRQYEKTMEEYQEEICRSMEKGSDLRVFDMVIQPEIKLHRTDVQQLSLPETPQIKEELFLQDVQQLSLPEPLQIKEEQDMWTSQGAEQLQGLQSDCTESILTFPKVKTNYHPAGSSLLPPLDQTPTVETETNTTEGQVKVESDKDYDGDYHGDYQEAAEPASVSQSSEEERGLLLERPACSLRFLPPRELKSPSKSRKTHAKCSGPIPSRGPCLKSKTSPSPWTRRVTSSHSESESEDVFSEGAESKVHHQCVDCGRAFTCKSALAIHRRIHTGEKPYQCEECPQAFSKKGTLVRHRRIHTGEKPYQCEECDQAFSQKGSLVQHRRIHTGEKPYLCKDCGQHFRGKGHLVSHRRIHTREKPFLCEECGQAFKHKISLNNHRRIHTGGTCR